MRLNEFLKKTTLKNSCSIYPDRGAGNDPVPLGLAFRHQSSTFYIVGSVLSTSNSTCSKVF